jgi:acyl-CoA dehydrogenase
MDLSPSPRGSDLLDRMRAFVAEDVIPSEARHALRARCAKSRGGDPHAEPEVLAELKVVRARSACGTSSSPHPVPGTSAGWRRERARLRALAEESGRSPLLAPEAINGAAPDTGNMELLLDHGTPEQQARGSRRSSTGRCARRS